MTFDRPSQHAFLSLSVLLFAASAALTVVWCVPMSAMAGMPMPGGWTMSMTWMRMPGQTWLGAASAFLLMWVVMMAAMMLPSLTPVLWRYRAALGNETCASRLTAIAAGGYFCVWTAFGLMVFPLGVALAAIEMRHAALARAVPVAACVIVMLAGALQFTAWKARHLACCRQAPALPGAAPLHSVATDAWRYGLRLGLHCSYSTTGLIALLLAFGVMDLRAMALVTAAITAERLAPSGERAAQAVGMIIIAVGLLLTMRIATTA